MGNFNEMFHIYGPLRETITALELVQLCGTNSKIKSWMTHIMIMGKICLLDIGTRHPHQLPAYRQPFLCLHRPIVRLKKVERKIHLHFKNNDEKNSKRENKTNTINVCRSVGLYGSAHCGITNKYLSRYQIHMTSY